MRALLPLLFFLYFTALFTFENIPASPAMRLVWKLSIEVVLLLAVLAAVRTFGWKLSRFAKASLSFAILALVLVRYVDITALGVLGRAFNLHGDFPHVHRVFAMFWEAMSLGSGLMVLAIAATVMGGAFALNWVGLTVWERALESKTLRQIVLYAAPVLAVVFFLTPGGAFSVPTTSIVRKQIQNLRTGEAGKRAAAEIEWPPQNFESNLHGLSGANVFLIFLESYGVTLIEDAHHFDAIGPRFRALEESLRQAKYHFASSQIYSPTFGGGSWRAHATFLSGFHVDSEHLYDALLASDRETLVSVLSGHGYRTVAAEPGIKWYWPDGEFYGFDRIYAFDDLGYEGPPMGWWKIPDQFTMYRLYQDEIQGAQKPLFAKFSLIMSHIPYFPIPEYVQDWSRFDDGTAFRGSLDSVAHDAYRDLRELSTWYVEAFRYELDILEGFLLDYVPENSLVIVVGDHQPPKLVTHNNDSWAVPMHVFSKRPELVQAFAALGFREGLVPLHPTSFTMAGFLSGFLEIYDEPSPASEAVTE